jgi:cytosine deaminase
MGLPPAGTATGLVADLLAVKGSDLADIIARAPEDRVVFHRGRVVAASRTHRRMMLG